MHMILAKGELGSPHITSHTHTGTLALNILHLLYLKILVFDDMGYVIQQSNAVTLSLSRLFVVVVVLSR